MKNNRIIAVLLMLVCGKVFAVEFSFFGDAKVIHDSDNTASFELGELNFIFSGDLSETTSTIADVMFTNGVQGYDIVVERLAITKEVSPLLYFTFGKYYKPVGFWLHNFNHASLAQDTVSRPFYLENPKTHSGIYPTHLIGLLMGGDATNWSYQLSVSNSTGIDTTSIPGSNDTETIELINGKDPGDDKTLVLRLTYNPLSSPLEFGFFAMKNSVVELGDTNTLVKRGENMFDQNIIGVDFNFSVNYFYMFAEYVNINTEDNPDMTSLPYVAQENPYNASAYYAQMGLRMGEKFTTALRYEALDFADNSTYFDLQGIVPENRTVLGLKYKFDESNAIRFEVNNATQKDKDAAMSFTLQWMFFLL